MPDIAIPSRCASAPGRSVSSLITSAIASAQSWDTLSTRSRTATSLVRSDSNTRRNGAPSRATNSKYAAIVAATRCLLSVVEASAARTRDTRLAGVLVQQREVEVELAREVLVEHRLGDTGAFGDLVHGGGVVARADEDLLRGLEQLGAACGPWQAQASAARVRAHRHWGSFRCARAQAAKVRDGARRAPYGRRGAGG